MDYTFATVFAKDQAAAQAIVGDGYFTTAVRKLPDTVTTVTENDDGTNTSETTIVEGTGGDTWYVSSGPWDNEPLMQIVNSSIEKIVRFPDGQMEGFELITEEEVEGDLE